MNLPRAIAMMVLAMACFAISDALIKLATSYMPLGQVILVFSAGSLVFFLVLLRSRGEAFWNRDVLHPSVLLRNGGEVIGSVGFTTALALTPLASASAILQAQPLAVTLAAALFLREPVGWRRFLAIGVGFTGVLLILRPGTDGFDLASLWAVLGVVGLTMRDLGSRMLPPGISSAFVAAWAFFLLIFIGMAMLALSGGMAPMGPLTIFVTLCTIVSVSIAFLTITMAMRLAPVAAVSPFRYTRMIFAIAIAMLFFGERPDMWMWIGLALIIGSGLFAFWRERRVAQPGN